MSRYTRYEPRYKPDEIEDKFHDTHADIGKNFEDTKDKYQNKANEKLQDTNLRYDRESDNLKNRGKEAGDRYGDYGRDRYNQAKNDYVEKVDDKKRELGDKANEYGKNIDDKKKEAGDRFNQEKDNYAKQIGSKGREVEDKFNQGKNNYGKNIDDKKREVGDRFNQEKDNYGKQIGSKGREVEDKFNQGKNDYGKNIDDKKRDIEDRFDQGKDKYEKKLDSKGKEVEDRYNDYSDKYKQTKSDYGKQFDEREKDIKKGADDVKRNAGKEIDHIKKDVDNKAHEIEAQGKQKVDDLKSELSDKQQELEDEALTKTKEIESEANDMIDNAKSEVDSKQKELENMKNAKVNELKNELDDAGKKKDELEKQFGNEAEKLKDNINTKDVSGKMQMLQSTASAVKGASEGSNQPGVDPVVLVETKDVALFAHNYIRKLHGVNPCKWDDKLAKQCEEWALHLAHSDGGLSHSEPLEGFGENLYISKGSTSATGTHQAVLQWYKTVMHYNFNDPKFNLSSGTFTQLVWDDSVKLGVGVAFREDTKNTYIVARYSPPGNGRYSESFRQHVKKPLQGLPAIIPKIEDLLPPDVPENGEQKPSNMKSIVGVLCHWCISKEEKPVESWSGVQQSEDTEIDQSKASKVKDNQSKTSKVKDSQTKEIKNNIDNVTKDFDSNK